MAKVVVFGATGLTGQLVVARLLELGVSDVAVAGRSADKVRTLAGRYGLEARVGDALEPSTLRNVVAGASVVVSTAGPFTSLGEPVVRAALDAGAHFLDTTGEQAYMARILERYHGVAKLARRAVINAQAFEFALGYCLSARLAASQPAFDTVDVFYRVAGGFVGTRGTQKSVLEEIIAPALVRRGGRLVRREAIAGPERVRVPGVGRDELAIPFPGGEALHLAHAHPQVKDVATYAVVPRRLAYPAMGVWAMAPLLRGLRSIGALRALERHIDSGPERPSDEQRAKNRFKVYARGRSPENVAGVVASGVDPYAVTGVIAALGARLLIDGPPRAVGVISTDQAFGADEFLAMLEPYGISSSKNDNLDT